MGNYGGRAKARITFRLDGALRKRIEKAADTETRTLSNMVYVLLCLGLRSLRAEQMKRPGTKRLFDGLWRDAGGDRLDD